MAGKISAYQAERWLDQLQNSWVALHYEDPDISGAYASEVFGGGYARYPVTFSSASGRSIWNETSVVFAGLPSVVVTYIGLWDAAVNGNHLATMYLDTPVMVGAGGSMEWGPTSIAVTLL